MKYTLSTLAVALAFVAPALSPVHAQDVPPAERPHVLGLADIALYVHDLNLSRTFYGDFLGFDQAFSMPPRPDGSVELVWFKVNDRQMIELFPHKEVGTDRLDKISFQTDDTEAMRLYLKSKGIAVPAKSTSGTSGSKHFLITDPDGHRVEFIQYLPKGWIASDVGKHLPDTRISARMSHAGIMVRDLDTSLKFYRDVLGFKETWRGSQNGRVLDWVNLKVPDGDDYVELMLYSTMPTLARINTMHHLCLEVPDVAKAAEILKARPMPKESKPATHIHVGVNGKRQINYYDPDGTRVEVMEASTVDGKPVPSSTAPAPSLPPPSAPPSSS
jgi:catechol 2,3-dioxygenase-like lactoylglutathione lyase family enzyme